MGKHSRRIPAERLEFDPEIVGRLLRKAENADEELPAMVRAVRLAWQTELTAVQRRYLHDYYAETMTMYEIAARYGVNVGTVSRTLARARNRLRNAMRYAVIANNGRCF